MRCDFCNFEFDPDQAEMTCSGCPLSKNCHLICCPRCGYQMMPEARLIGWWKKIRRINSPIPKVQKKPQEKKI